jgi:3-isopropylmalate/(R)-2-methylmalate dehydratase small subunit
MEAVRTIRGRMAPLDRANVDTDQIIPKQFLKSIGRTGFGEHLFHDWRREGGFVLDRDEYRGAAVLVTGPNFGCGSSREHAAWALQQAGFKAVIAPSFSDIFRNNSHKIGLLPVQLSSPEVQQLMRIAEQSPATAVEIDLAVQSATSDGFHARFEIDPFVKECLLNGWDDIAVILRNEAAIARYEVSRPDWLPRVGTASKL